MKRILAFAVIGAALLIGACWSSFADAGQHCQGYCHYPTTTTGVTTSTTSPNTTVSPTSSSVSPTTTAVTATTVPPPPSTTLAGCGPQGRNRGSTPGAAL